jgi:hypothetical protein
MPDTHACMHAHTRARAHIHTHGVCAQYGHERARYCIILIDLPEGSANTY